MVACVLENGIQYPEKWRSIFSSNQDSIPGIPLFNLSLACNHCEDAPCMKGCPSLAYSMDITTGAILIDSELCIGCRYCTWNCPYGAPKYNPISKVIEKCNFCNSRLLENLEPSCAVSCPTGALDFSFDEIDKKVIAPTIEVPKNPNPSIIIHGLINKAGPEIDKKLTAGNDLVRKISKSNISAIKEFPLLIFTFVISCMTAVSASGINSNFDIKYRILFLLTGGVAASLSVLHLGKKSRFWRSILNIKNSWLSREILFFSIYFMLSIIDLIIYKLPLPLIVVFAILTLLSVDMLYKPLQWKWKLEWHSGQVIIIAISMFLLIAQFYFALSIFYIIRMIIMLFQFPERKVLTIMRFLIPLLGIILLTMDNTIILAMIVFVLGELMDRILFYNDLSEVKVGDLISSKQ